MTLLQNPYSAYMYIWGYKDLLELLFFSWLLYRISLWLNKDTTRTLVWYLYGYCTLIIACHCIQLPLLTTLLISYSPVAALIGILMHQDSLAKYLAVPTKILPAHLDTLWLDELLQAFLIAMHSNKQIICIIENKDSLESLISTEFSLNTPLKKSILSMLIESLLFDSQAMIWISSTGTLKGINCTWIRELNTQDNWTTALTVCTKIDAIAIKSRPEKNSFDLVLHGNHLENLTSTNCRVTLLQYLTKSNFSEKLGRSTHSKGKLDEKNHA